MQTREHPWCHDLLRYSDILRLDSGKCLESCEDVWSIQPPHTGGDIRERASGVRISDTGQWTCRVGLPDCANLITGLHLEVGRPGRWDQCRAIPIVLISCLLFCSLYLLFEIRDLSSVFSWLGEFTPAAMHRFCYLW